MDTIKLIIYAVMIVTTFAHPASENTGSENDLITSIYSDCLRRESMSCIKYKVFSFVDKILSNKEDISLSDDLTIVKTSNIDEGAPRSIQENNMETLLFDRLERFLRSRSIKVDLKGTDVLEAVESINRIFENINDSSIEGREKKKKTQKIMGPILMAIAFKAAALIPIALGFIALIAGKALLVGKIALVISTIIGLKKLLGGQQKHVTYEVVSHPQHGGGHPVSHDDGGHSSYSGGGGGGGGSDFSGYSGGGSSSGGHGSSGWARSLSEEKSQSMAYSAQKPQTKSVVTH